MLKESRSFRRATTSATAFGRAKERRSIAGFESCGSGKQLWQTALGVRMIDLLGRVTWPRNTSRLSVRAPPRHRLRRQMREFEIRFRG